MPAFAARRSQKCYAFRGTARLKRVGPSLFSVWKPTQTDPFGLSGKSKVGFAADHDSGRNDSKHFPTFSSFPILAGRFNQVGIVCGSARVKVSRDVIYGPEWAQNSQLQTKTVGSKSSDIHCRLHERRTVYHSLRLLLEVSCDLKSRRRTSAPGLQGWNLAIEYLVEYG